MIPDLLIPLAWLPRPLPVGAPLWADRHVKRPEDDALMLAPLCGEGVYAGHTLDDGPPVALALPPMQPIMEVAPHHVTPETCLDLTPPPLADGYPTRIDGLDVAAAMLARAMRLPGSPAWLELCDSADAPAGYRVRLRAMRFGRWPLPLVYLDTLAGPLPTVDPADPLAVRRLMVELYRRRVWGGAP